MEPRHPEPSPELLLDRSLGSVRVPKALRDAGVRLRTLADIYGSPEDENIADTEWLELAGSRKMPVLMKDQRIRHRPAERAAVLENGVQAFCLASGNLKADDMAQLILSAMPAIYEACASAGAAFYMVTKTGLHQVSLEPDSSKA